MILDSDGCQLHRHELTISTMLGLRDMRSAGVLVERDLEYILGWYMNFKTKVDCSDAAIGILVGEGEKV